jgi:putative transposase
VRGIHPSDPLLENWIGVDLNTTGHIAVIAHPGTGRVMKLGRNAHQIHAKYEKLKDNFEKHKKHRKLKKIEHREEKILQDLVTKISRQVVYCALFLHAGIKLERINGSGPDHAPAGEALSEYAITSKAFRQLQSMIDNRAKKAGIPVVYIDPSFTSQKCCRCGKIGIRRRKKFECPGCGYAEHADVNAAFNIADAAFEIDRERALRESWHEARRTLRQQLKERQHPRHPDFVTFEKPLTSTVAVNLLCTLDHP